MSIDARQELLDATTMYVALSSAEQEGVPIADVKKRIDGLWTRIEAVYGRKLSIDVRQELLDATTAYVALSSAEQEGVPIADVKKRIDGILKSANSLASGLVPEPKADGSLQLAIDLIEHRFDRDLGAFHGVLSVLLQACREAQADLHKLRPLTQVDAWTAWVRELTAIVKRHRLPFGVRKDLDGVSGSLPCSPFIHLVKSINKKLPEIHQKHGHSEAALSAAVFETRRLHRRLRGK